MNIKKLNISYCYISSYCGVSIGASHVYGEISNESSIEHFHLKKILSEKEAKILTLKHRDIMEYQEGDTTECFDTEEDLINTAKSSYKTYFPDSNILLLGKQSYFEPKLVIDYPEWFNIKKANKLYEQAKQLEFFKYSKNDAIMDKITNQFYKLIQSKYKQ